MSEALTEKELVSQLSSVLGKRQAQFVGLHLRVRWDGGPEIRCHGETFEVCQPRSVLEFYQRLLEAEERGTRLVCLTELESRELGLDILTRLFRRRLHSTDRWTAVKSRFRAQAIEAGLVDQDHLARYLIDYEPPQGYTPVQTPMLTADKVWSCLFRYALAMPSEYLDVFSLLGWASGDTSQYRTAPEDLKKSARERVLRQCGELGRAIMACVDSGRVNPLALGLALRCVFCEKPQLAQQAAAVRLERYLGDRPLDPELGQEWAAAAEHLYREEDDAPALVEAERVLGELGVLDYAFLSDLLPAGRAQRLARFGGLLNQALDDPRRLGGLEQQSSLCAAHRGLPEQARRRLEMVPRLLRWLGCPGPSGDGLGEWARYFVDQGSFADWARLRCEGSQGTPEAAAALCVLGERVVARLEQESRSFALACQAWNQSGEASGQVLGVEEVLERVLVPLVSGKGDRALLIVLDGCNWATMHELLAGLTPFWTLRRPREGRLLPVMAAFPSVTEYSRTSLLSGRLTGGNASNEVQNFRDHPGLRGACNSGYPPALFHKADLEGEFGQLADAVESRILETKSKVVAVVVNAVDDHLDSDDQLERVWDLASIKHLLTLLDLAYKSGRAVVLASDHGHTLERGSELRPGQDGGARWQTGRVCAEGEIELCGRRVLCQADRVVMPWSEKIRYTKKKNGYHGGAHPRELLAPLVVLAPRNRMPQGWIEIPRQVPNWWSSSPAAPPRPKPREKKPAPPPPSGQLSLFLEDAPAGPDLAQRVLGFPLIAEQWKQHKGKALDRDLVRRLLQLLEDRGCRAPVEELATALALPEVRVRETLAALSPILTVDGVPVLAMTADASSVFLNPGPLEQQSARPRRDPGRIEVETTAGKRLSFAVPLEKLDRVERLILEGLARHGQLSEVELKKHTGSKRVAGKLERLMEKLHKAGFSHLRELAAGDQGRVYALDREAL